MVRQLYRKTISKINLVPKTILYLGLAMFLINLSYIMIFSLFGVYLKSIGETQTKIGVLEGAVEAISQLMKLSSGLLSDLLRKRKMLLAVGFSFTVLSRPIMAMSSTFLMGAIGRVCDRLGNGIQATPRDALIADSSPRNKRGESFGLVRSMGQLGPILGGLLAAFLMKVLGFGFKQIFFVSVIPAFLAFLIILLKVKDINFTKKSVHQAFHWHDLKKTGVNFSLLMLVNFVFMLARLGETFMTLHASININLQDSSIPLVMVVFNIGYCVFSYPIGVLADRVGRFSVLAAGIMSLIIADLLFFKATTVNEFWLGVIFWGIQMGITTNIFTSLVVDMVHPSVRGTAFGIYFLINAFCVFVADSYAGYISQIYSQHYAYLISAFIGSLSLLILMLVMKYRNLADQY